MAKFNPAEVFESRPCDRCGGSGRYSFNLIHGSVCYGCQGAGVVYTEAGLKARDEFNALRVRKAPATEVKAGDVVKVNSPYYGQRFRRIEEVTGPEVSQWRIEGEERIPLPSVGFVFKFRGERVVSHHSVDAEVEIALPDAPGLEAMVGRPGVNPIRLNGDRWERIG